MPYSRPIPGAQSASIIVIASACLIVVVILSIVVFWPTEADVVLMPLLGWILWVITFYVPASIPPAISLGLLLLAGICLIWQATILMILVWQYVRRKQPATRMRLSFSPLLYCALAVLLYGGLDWLSNMKQSVALMEKFVRVTL